MRIDRVRSLFEAFEIGTLYIFGIETVFSRICWRITSYISIIYNYADAVRLSYPGNPVQDIVSEVSLFGQDMEMPYISQRSKFQNLRAS